MASSVRYQLLFTTLDPQDNKCLVQKTGESMAARKPDYSLNNLFIQSYFAMNLVLYKSFIPTNGVSQPSGKRDMVPWGVVGEVLVSESSKATNLFKLSFPRMCDTFSGVRSRSVGCSLVQYAYHCWSNSLFLMKMSHILHEGEEK